MEIEAGTLIGPYEIVSRLGEGGMGVVYRAVDTRLNRTVAIKILRAQHTDRFEREARAISALNHPNICALFDVGNHEGAPYLVMEFVDGTPWTGPMEWKKAFRLAAQVAAALDAAHQKGVVHRDLKPPNILVTKNGVKLLDFGVAKILAPEKPASPGPEGDTLTNPETIVGTPRYMSPEQIESREIDGRADVFALGCVLYEVLSGRAAFEGNSQAGTLAAVLTREPPSLADLAEPVAPQAERLVRKCLAKPVEERWQSARDLAGELAWLSEQTAPLPRPAPPPPPKFPALAAGIALAVVLAAGIAVGYFSRGDSTPVSTPVRFQVFAPPSYELTLGRATVAAPAPAVSPDGRSLAFAATNLQGVSMLWVRNLEEAEPRMIAETDDATDPFWSAASDEIAFFAQGKLKRVGRQGGAPVTICDAAGDFRSGTWNQQGEILFSLANEIFRVKAAGGSPERATRIDTKGGQAAHRWPRFLPDGRHFLYHVRGADSTHRGLYAGRLGDIAFSKPIADLSHNAVYAGPGYLLYLDGSSLVARPFDANSLTLSGDPHVVASGVMGATNSYAAISVSSTGVIAYSSGVANPSKPSWYDRRGNLLSVVEPEALYTDVEISRRGDHAALTRQDPRAAAPDIWTLDIVRNTFSRFTSDPALDASPLWTPDGAGLIFRSNRSGFIQIFRATLDDPNHMDVISGGFSGKSGDANSYLNAVPNAVSPDGKLLVMTSVSGAGTSDFSIQATSGEGTPLVSQTPAANENHAAISPDGKWMAYSSDETGRYEIYIQSFPQFGRKIQVSVNGGTEPRWRGDGRELFYIANERTLMAAPVGAGEPPSPGRPVPLFPTRTPRTPTLYRRTYDVTPNGDRFLVATLSEEAMPPSITVVTGWSAAAMKAK